MPVPSDNPRNTGFPETWPDANRKHLTSLTGTKSSPHLPMLRSFVGVFSDTVEHDRPEADSLNSEWCGTGDPAEDGTRGKPSVESPKGG